MIHVVTIIFTKRVGQVMYFLALAWSGVGQLILTALIASAHSYCTY